MAQSENRWIVWMSWKLPMMIVRESVLSVVRLQESAAGIYIARCITKV